MLKIKDNVDLKELEKFGLIPIYDEYTGNIKGFSTKNYHSWYLIFKKHKLKFMKNKNKDYFELYCRDKEGREESLNYSDIDLLYDLIQAGLVEKINE